MNVVLILMGLLITLAVVALLFAFYLIGLYNNLVTLKNRFQNAYSQIDVQLKRRYDLIPNLVETAKGFMKHERETLEAVIKARNTAMAAGQKAAANPGDPSAIQNLSTAEVALAGSLNRFIGLAEAYPELKANQNMLALQEELTSTENKISFARQGFNDAVTTYNTATETFPGNLVAGFGNFQKASLWELSEPEQREPVKVSF
ncbi:MAG: LemA family protein [Planctomycetaceae bacterium]|jgi:LemA protein|nr:LemA family protein [Planctomycetaceae bacterium]